jgi:hypothetical protein
MSYAYLFKYIIIGDTGIVPTILSSSDINPTLQGWGNHVCFYNLLIKDFNQFMI